MRAFVIAEAIYFVFAAFVFAVLYGFRSRWRRSWTGRNVMAFVVGVGTLIVTQVVDLVWPIPMWVYAIIIAELCYAMTERIWLLWIAQHR